MSSWLQAVTTGQLRYAALAGLGAGLFAAAKYTGLLFAAATDHIYLDAGHVVDFANKAFEPTPTLLLLAFPLTPSPALEPI